VPSATALSELSEPVIKLALFVGSCPVARSVAWKGNAYVGLVLIASNRVAVRTIIEDEIMKLSIRVDAQFHESKELEIENMKKFSCSEKGRSGWTT
jgi:hypothetical protein